MQAAASRSLLVAVPTALVAAVLALVIVFSETGVDIRIGLLLLALIVPAAGWLLQAPASTRAGVDAAVGAGTGARGGARLLSLWLLLLGACPAYIYFGIGPVTGLNPVRLCFLALIGVWVFQLSHQPPLRARLVSRMRSAPAVSLIMLVWLAWSMLCAAAGDIPQESIRGVLQDALSAVVVFFMVLTYIDRASDLRLPASALVVGAALGALVGIVESQHEGNLFVALFPSDPEQRSALGWILESRMRSGLYRVSGTYTHPLSFGEFLCLAMPFAFLMARAASRLWLRATALGCIVLMAAAVYCTHTRSALVVGCAELAAGCIWLLHGTRSAGSAWRQVMVWTLLLAGAAAAFAASDRIRDVVLGQDREEIGSANVRVTMLDAGLQAIRAHPWLGHGSGTGALVLRIGADAKHFSIDNYFLSAAIETGVLGLVLFVLTLALPLAAAVRALPSAAGPRAAALQVGIAAVLGSVVIKTILSLPDNFDLLFFCLGLLSVLSRGTAEHEA